MSKLTQAPLTVLLLCGSTQAFGQAAPDAPAATATTAQASPVEAAPTVSTPVEPEASTQDGGLADVVVTARRRSERLQDVPVSITALTSDALRSAGAVDVRQLTVAVPGFTGGRNFGVLQPTIRGVGSAGVSLGDEANVAVYVDGVYQPNSFSNIVDFVEVDRIEVLRGPQGTLFGRNATGGLVNIITPDPDFQFHGKASAQFGFYRGATSQNLRSYVTGALSDTLAADASVILRRSDGYIDNVSGGGKTGGSGAVNLRSKFLYRPSDTFQAVLTLSYVDQHDNAGNSTQPLNGNTIGNLFPTAPLARRPFEISPSFEPKIRIRAFNAALRLKLDVGALNVETTTGYLKDHVDQASDTDGAPALGSASTLDPRNEAISQEIRLLSSKDETFQWILGGYAYHLRGTVDLLSGTGIAPNYTVFNPNRIIPVAEVSSLAGFGEGTLRISDALRLTGGVRYTTEQRDFRTTVNGVAPFAPQRIDFNRWAYRGTAQYFFTPKTNVYLTYSTGFKSGVFNTFGTSPLPTKPETIAALEGGLKSEPLSWLRTNIAVFKYDYDNLQVQARLPNSASYVIQNAAKAKISGVDFEIEAAATAALRLRFAANYLHARYASFPNAQVFVPIPIAGTALFRGNAAATVDVSGNDMIRAPRYTLSFSPDWTIALANDARINLTGNIFHSAKVYYEFGNRIVQPAYTMINAEAAWISRDESVRLSVYGRNLTDARVFQQANANTFADLVTYERPVEIGASMQVTF